MANNIKDMIKIPEKLDDAILKGFERGKKEKKSENRKLILKRSTIAAGVIVASTTLAGIINPDIVSAIPVVGNIFEYFNDGIYKQASNKYEELGNVINTTVENNGVNVTLNKVIVDDNIFVASLLIESDKLLGYDELRSTQDFLNADFNIVINRQLPSSYSSNVTIINKKTAAVILEVNVSDLKLSDEVNIDLDIINITRGNQDIARGKWNFDIKTIKGSETKTYEINKGLSLRDENINFEKLVVSDLVNRLEIKGIFNDYDNFYIDENSFIVRDNNGNILTTEFKSGWVEKSDKNYKYSFDILNDLDDKEYIEIIKADGNKPIRKDINGFSYYLLKASSANEENTNRNNEIISRNPTEEQLKDGYALDKVIYNVDIDKTTAFESIDNLIGKEIAVNNTDKIIIKDIISKEDYTDVVMKVDGSYNYKLLSSIVLFDEDMNDSCVFEGSITKLNDIKENIVTVRLTKIDTSKKYTIAIPVTTDLNLNENEKITINLK